MSYAKREQPPSGLFKWIREEGFWREVASGTVSSLIVVLSGYLYAVLAGYIGNVSFWRAVGAALFMVAFFIVTSLYVRQVRRVTKATDYTGIGIGVLVIFWTPLFFVCAGALLIALDVLLNWQP
ncbi:MULTISPECIES: hypothetical protein [Mycobacteriaceae]|uniref:Uncharacterized protein n=1 Tax=Mycolicibacterium parafortuitum TaxID=39692 RepID=A0ACC6MPR5_MYCPF|nr:MULTISPECIES: hypothetical protein [Mycobacteriaceae]MDZ5088928.1 hypothetical protein [Mycolicibacterium parafortuitum]GFM20570.1 ABC transporter, ATP-binding protein [Mycobacterium sp. PO1]GFM26713.1 ABC transporter, ATP-binding protein [Mycobacterium sp. PO2]